MHRWASSSVFSKSIFVLNQPGRTISYIAPITRKETAERSFYCHGTMVLTNNCECT